MRKASVDANQSDVVAALRAIGASVALLHRVGGGVPDLLVGFRGIDGTVEVKDGDKPASERKLRATQIEWHQDWQGRPPVTVESPQEAVDEVMTWGLE